MNVEILQNLRLLLQKFFRDQLDYFNDDLLLSVAAYNCGQGRIRSSVKKSGKADATYWDIKKYLPAETRKFVMNFIALNVIFSNYEKFLNKELNFNEPPLIQIASRIQRLQKIPFPRLHFNICIL